MNFLFYILSFFGCCRAPNKPIALQSSPLGKLPQELILAIGNLLPPPGLACLGLYCTTLYFILRVQCQRVFQDAGNLTKMNFLRLLERDLPQHIVCPSCHKLHSMSKAENYLRYKRWCFTIASLAPCELADYKDRIEWRTYHEFSSVIFLMAMKAHRQGDETAKLLDLLSTKPMYECGTGFVSQRSVIVRIQKQSLLVREQTVFLVPFSQQVPLPRYGFFPICNHISIWNMESLYRLGIRVPYADEIEQHENTEGIMFCEQSCTEFRVDFKSYGAAGNAMFLTKWMDIGKDLDDPKFRRRLLWSESDERINAIYSRGALCAAFEQKPAEEFDFKHHLSQSHADHMSNLSLEEWPEGSTRTFDHIEQDYEPRNGRFVSVRQGTLPQG